MTIVNMNGEPIGKEAEEAEWMLHAILSWLSDERTGQVILRQRVITRQQAQGTFAGLLAVAQGKATIDPSMVRAVMLRLLQNQVVRIRIAAQVLAQEARTRQEIGDEDEDTCVEYPPLRSRREVMAELQNVRLELEVSARTAPFRPDYGIIRPC